MYVKREGKLSDVKISRIEKIENGYGTRVEINGVEVNNVKSIRFEHDAMDVARLLIEIYPSDLELNQEMEVIQKKISARDAILEMKPDLARKLAEAERMETSDRELTVAIPSPTSPDPNVKAPENILIEDGVVVKIPAPDADAGNSTPVRVDPSHEQVVVRKDEGQVQAVEVEKEKVICPHCGARAMILTSDVLPKANIYECSQCHASKAVEE